MVSIVTMGHGMIDWYGVIDLSIAFPQVADPVATGRFEMAMRCAQGLHAMLIPSDREGRKELLPGDGVGRVADDDELGKMLLHTRIVVHWWWQAGETYRSPPCPFTDYWLKWRVIVCSFHTRKFSPSWRDNKWNEETVTRVSNRPSPNIDFFVFVNIPPSTS